LFFYNQKNAEAAARGETNDLDDALEAAEKNAGYAASYSKLSSAYFVSQIQRLFQAPL
jgi:hypothetical protein|tara:strand:- start:775 stop:948 length:174 start_codon:yes stop_codon:yes gene_type:complete